MWLAAFMKYRLCAFARQQNSENKKFLDWYESNNNESKIHNKMSRLLREKTMLCGKAVPFIIQTNDLAHKIKFLHHSSARIIISQWSKYVYVRKCLSVSVAYPFSN